MTLEPQDSKGASHTIKVENVHDNGIANNNANAQDLAALEHVIKLMQEYKFELTTHLVEIELDFIGLEVSVSDEQGNEKIDKENLEKEYEFN